LVEHSHDCHHSQARVGKLHIQLLLSRFRIRDHGRIATVEDEVLAHAKDAVVLEVAWCTLWILPEKETLVVAEEQTDLEPALERNL